MPYLNLDLDYFSHPKTLRLSYLLHGHRAEMLPIMLWLFTAKHYPDNGIIKASSPDELRKLIGYSGKIKSKKLVQALLNSGFLEKIKGGYQVHDWLDHAGHLAAFKKRAKLAAEIRWRKYSGKQPRKGSPNKSVNPPPQKSPAPPSSNGFLNFTEDQILEIRVAIAQSLNQGLMSEANEINYQDLKNRITKYINLNKVENPFAYALKSAKNLKTDK